MFCGQGPQWWGMGRELLSAHAVYRAAIEAIAAVMDPLSGWSLLEQFRADASSSRVQDTEIAQPMLFATQVALATTLKALGIEPAAVVGHSVGEISAAHIAGALTLEQAARIAVHRGRLMQRATGGGRMVAVSLTAEQAETAVTRYAGRLSLAAVNGPSSVVLSGDGDAVNALVRELESHGTACRVLPVNYAFHSYQMEALVPDLRVALADASPAPVTLPIISTVTGFAAASGDFGVDYWVRNLTSPVRFAAAIGALADAGYDTFVEVGPHPVLATSIVESLAGRVPHPTIVATQHRGRPESVSLLAAVGHLHASGQPVDWRRIYPAGRVVSLPPYPWQRERYWNERPAKESSPALIRGTPRTVRFPGERLRSPALQDVVFAGAFSALDPPFVADHRIHHVVVFPAAGYVSLALAAAAAVFGDNRSALSNMAFDEALVLDATSRQVQIIFTRDANGAAFRVVSLADAADDRWLVHATGRIARGESPEAPGEADRGFAHAGSDLDVEAHYAGLQRRGCDFGPAFRRVRRLRHGVDCIIADIDATPQSSDIGSVAIEPAVLDACFQAVQPLLPDSDDTFLPVALGAVRIFGPCEGALRAVATVTRSLRRNAIVAAVTVADEFGRACVQVEGLQLRQSSRAAVRRAFHADQDWLHAVAWEPSPLGPLDEPRPRRWVVMADTGGMAQHVARELESRGHCVRMLPSSDTTALAQVLAPADADMAVDGIIHLAALDSCTAEDMDAADVQGRVEVACVAVLDAAKAAVTAGGLPAGFWIVTGGAQPAGLDARPANPAQSAILGLGRVIALEHPELGCHRVDLDPGAAAAAAAQLADEIAGRSSDHEVVVRRGVRLVPRLERVTAAARRAASLDPVPVMLAISHGERLTACNSSRRPDVVPVRVRWRFACAPPA